MARLTEISNNQIPSSGLKFPSILSFLNDINTGETLIPKPFPAKFSENNDGGIPSPVNSLPPNIVRYPASNTGRGAARSAVASPASRGGRGSYRGSVIRPLRPPPPAQSGARGKAPFNIQNMSISISVVDQTVGCTQCTMTFKNSNMLAEHTKSVHLARFASLGLSITAPGEKKPVLTESGSLSQSPGGD